MVDSAKTGRIVALSVMAYNASTMPFGFDAMSIPLGAQLPLPRPLTFVERESVPVNKKQCELARPHTGLVRSLRAARNYHPAPNLAQVRTDHAPAGGTNQTRTAPPIDATAKGTSRCPMQLIIQAHACARLVPDAQRVSRHRGAHALCVPIMLCRSTSTNLVTAMLSIGSVERRDASSTTRSRQPRATPQRSLRQARMTKR